MMKYTHVYALLLMSVFCSFCKGQNKTDLPKADSKLENREAIASQGPKTITRNIIQDRKGNIWAAAFDGIFRYDGKSFTSVTSNVSPARFFSVLEDKKGNFWFASVGSGVFLYDGKSFRNFTTRDGLANDRVTHIYEDKAGNIWFGTEGGASSYDGKSFRNFKINEAPNVTQTDSVHTSTSDSVHISAYQQRIPESNWIHNDINAIIEDKTGKLWFGTRGYARVYDGKTFTVITRKDGEPFKNIRSIIRDRKGNIWLAGADGLWRYDGSTFTNFTRKFVGYVYEDKKGNIWTSSESSNDPGKAFSVYGANPATWTLSRYDEKSLSGKEPAVTEIRSGERMIFGILEAYDGSIWFGTMNGVYFYDGKSIRDFKGEKIKE